MSGSIFQRLFAGLYDFVFKGGLKKTVIGLVLGMFLLVSIAYIAFPQTTAAIVMGSMGLQDEDFQPPQIEAGENVYTYEGTWQGSAGPVGTGIGGEVVATVDWDQGVVSAEMEGDEISDGFMEGTVDSDTGHTEGGGAVNAFGLSGVSFVIEGEYETDGTSASGTWESTGEISGDGTWEVEMTEEDKQRFLEAQGEADGNETE